jgi:hypothetical protein
MRTMNGGIVSIVTGKYNIVEQSVKRCQMCNEPMFNSNGNAKFCYECIVKRQIIQKGERNKRLRRLKKLKGKK